MKKMRTSIGFYGIRASCEGDGFALAESVYPAGFRMPTHEHEPAYLSVLLRGAYTETAAGDSRTCTPETVVFQPPHGRHRVAFHNVESRIFRIELKRTSLERVRECGGIPERSTDFRGVVLRSLATRLYLEFQTSDSCSPLAIEGLTLEMMAEVSRQYLRRSSCYAPKWLESAREILHEAYIGPPSLDVLARMVGVHPVYLAREFRRRYRCTVGEYVRRRRVEVASREMSGSDMPLSEVAATAGFYDQSHFTNTFKRYTGMTPTAYRAAVRLQLSPYKSPSPLQDT